MSFRPPRSLPILTLFHNVKSNKSRQALVILQNKQKNANGEEKYRIDIMDENQQTPTDTQLKQIASFLNSPTPWKEMLTDTNDIGNAQDAFHVLKNEPGSLRCPIVVDWENGKAVGGSSTLEAVEKLIDERKK
jgi:arsenate reductase-like glutaredoxin family protein